MNRLLFIPFTIIVFFNFPSFGQDYIDLAKRAYKKQDYQKAINILHEAKLIDPNNAEIYLLLGWYNHYLVADSRPHIGNISDISDKILSYLDTALLLNPELKDVYYWIGAEYGARAINSLYDGNYQKVTEAYVKGKELGGYPLWLLEHGRNILKSCDKDAILFLGGDATLNSVRYLQLVEKYRKDVTAIAFGLLDHPWYILKLKEGIDNILRSAPIAYSKEIIMNMRPYKWDTLDIHVCDSIVFRLSPDLKSNNRTFLSPMRNMFYHIVETNEFKRPIHIDYGSHPDFYFGTREYFSIEGLTYKINKSKQNNNDIGIGINVEKIEEEFMRKENFIHINDIVDHDLPQASGMQMNYLSVLYNLAKYYALEGNDQKIEEIKSFISSLFDQSIYPKTKFYIELIDDLDK